MAFEVNKLQRDEFGRVNGIVAVNKPAGITSHDVVDIARRAFQTKKVGHAGALDPFATGILILLIGKATKLSDKFINSDKEYIAKVLFGIQTDSADTEGEVLQVSESVNIAGLKEALAKFVPEYTQYVPVFSSIKVDGQKLRVLARQAQSHSVVTREDGKHAIFQFADKNIDILLPTHLCKILEIELLSQDDNYDISNQAFYTSNTNLIKNTTWQTADIRVSCSKGTYIRTLAEDIGNALPNPTPAMLVGLERTRVDRISIKNAVTVDELSQL